MANRTTGLLAALAEVLDHAVGIKHDSPIANHNDWLPDDSEQGQGQAPLRTAVRFKPRIRTGSEPRFGLDLCRFVQL